MREWAVAPLGELACVRRGISYSESTLQDNREDGRPYINMKSFLKDGGYNRDGLKFFSGAFSKADIATGSDLLLANTDVTPGGDIIGVPAYLPDYLLDEGALFSHHVTRLSLNGSIRPKYLYYLLCIDTYRRWMRKYSRGTTVLMLDMNALKRVPIHYAACDRTQKKITDILGRIDTAIEKTEALIEKYQQIKAGLMHDLFTRGVLPNGQLRPPREQAPEMYRQTALGWLPKDWGLCRIDDCGEVKLGRQRSPDQHSGKWTMPYLRVANVFDGFIDFSDVLEMDFTPNERRLFSLVDGDILLNEGQSLELVGRSSIYRGESDQFCFQNTLVRFRCNSENSPAFFAHLFKFWLDGGQFQCIAKQTTSVAHLGADRFARMFCPAVEIGEQLLIEERLDLIDKQIGASKAHLHKLKKQKLGLMQDLLTGKVPVKVAAESMESIGG